GRRSLFPQAVSGSQVIVSLMAFRLTPFSPAPFSPTPEHAWLSGRRSAGSGIRRIGVGGLRMERAVEWFVAVTPAVVGLSHLLRRGDWAEAFRQLHRCGRPGAFVNGALSLVPGAAVVAGHGSWAWPGAVLTAFGWLLIAKAAVCFLAPDKALR